MKNDFCFASMSICWKPGRFEVAPEMMSVYTAAIASLFSRQYFLQDESCAWTPQCLDCSSVETLRYTAAFFTIDKSSYVSYQRIIARIRVPLSLEFGTAS